jgi:transcriptional regulator with XRE-family HTH domain
MAEKGDKAKLYDIAMRMYVEGQSLTAIEAALGVSRQTLSAWKADTRKPSEDADAWDLARQVKRSNVQRLRALFERELRNLEESAAGSLNNVSLDAITKLGTLVQRWEQMEATAALKDGAQRSALFLDFVRDLIAFGGRQDPDLVSAIEANFDDIIAWGQEKYGI